MDNKVWLNGEIVDADAARVSVFDRGFLFADSVYELTAVLRARLVDSPAHLARLHRSLDAIGLKCPASDSELVVIQKALIAANDIDEGVVYLQVTRGPAERDYAFPAEPSPTVVAFTQKRSLIDTASSRRGIRVVTVPDLRWQRCDIKSTGLLGASMARQSALDAGVDDAWMCTDGFITEGTSNNAYIVDKNGTIFTRRLGNDILPGVTRAAILRLIDEEGLALREDAFTVAQARNAQEAFATSASTFVLPVIEIDGYRLGNGSPGSLTMRLRQLYIETALGRLAD